MTDIYDTVNIKLPSLCISPVIGNCHKFIPHEITLHSE